MTAVETAEELGLYISVPFCRAKCTFCNFASGVSSADAVERYVRELCEEICGTRDSAARLGAEVPLQADTVYFGGGTPSLLSPEQLRRIFEAVGRSFHLSPDAEITMEAAPGQIGDALLEEALQLGVNRVSLGVQSFQDRETSAVGRSHTCESCLAEFARLGVAGVANVGADLIAGLPYQTAESWEETLQIAVHAQLSHLSVYMFEVDDDSRLGQEVIAGGLRLHAPRVPGDDLVACLYERACAVLPASGFAQYEISNFACSGFESRHNRRYWTRSPYLGFGLDAHSMLRRDGGVVRFANPEELQNYRGAESYREISHVSLREAFEEEVFLGLRMLRGVAVERLQGIYPKEWIAEANAAAHEVAQEGLMQNDNGIWQLTMRGRLLSNEVFGHLLAAVTA